MSENTSCFFLLPVQLPFVCVEARSFPGSRVCAYRARITDLLSFCLHLSAVGLCNVLLHKEIERSEKVKVILLRKVQLVENQGIVKSKKCHIPSPHLFTLFAEAISEKKRVKER